MARDLARARAEMVDGASVKGSVEKPLCRVMPVAWIIQADRSEGDDWLIALSKQDDRTVGPGLGVWRQQRPGRGVGRSLRARRSGGFDDAKCSSTTLPVFSLAPTF